MKKILILFVSCILFLVSYGKAGAAVSTQSATTNITVTVSGYVLNVTGYIAPFASIALTINDTVITSTVADEQGNFTFTNVAVPKATSTVCFDAIDFKKLGESLACISVTPINGVITKTSVYLPPTLGVQRVDVFVGDNADAFGYGMPGASITVHVNGSTGCAVTADTTGYYICHILIQKAGTYTLFADAVLNGKPSEAQLKKILINGITSSKATLTPVPTLPAFPGLFAIPWWVWLLLILIAIILIIILLRKYIPKGVPVVGIPAVGAPGIRLAHLFDFLFKEKKLHHHWMKGVGY